MVEHSRSQTVEDAIGACPRCGSPYIQTFEMAWRSGTVGVHLTSVYGSRSLGAFYSSIAPQGEQQTELARATSPPAEPGPDAALALPVVLLIVGCIALLVLLFSQQDDMVRRAPTLVPSVGVAFAGAALVYLLLRPLVRRRRAREQADYDRQMGEWRNSWVCTKCGLMWISEAICRQ